MHERYFDLRTIFIPKRFTPYGEDVKIDVQPLNDRWLISPERTWEEVDRVLEDRLQTIQQSFLFDKEPTARAKAYGLESSPNGNTARFLAYVELVDEYRVIDQRHTSAAVVARERYEREKEEVKQSRLSGGKKKQRVEALWKEKYNPSIQQAVAKSQEARQVQRLILRKAAIDLFSANKNTPPLFDDRFADLVKNAKDKTSAAQSQVAKRKPISFFLVAEAAYLQRTQDQSLFRRLQYRKSAEMIEKPEDCQVLLAILENTVNPQVAHAPINGNNEVRDLARSFLEFSKAKAIFDSQTQLAGKYPVLSLIRDLYTVCFYQQKSTVLAGIKTLIDQSFYDLPSSPSLSAEIDRVCTKWSELAKNIFPRFTGEWAKLAKTTDFMVAAHYLDILPEEFVDMITGIENRIFLTFASLPRGLDLIVKTDAVTALPAYPVPKLIQDLSSRFLANPRIAKVRQAYQNSSADLFLQRIDYTPLLSRRGIQVDLLSQTSFALMKRESGETPGEAQSDFLRRVHVLLERQDPSYRFPAGQALNLYLNNFWPTSEALFETEKENEFLWREIIDNPTWFVSPRGDRFRGRSDSYLADHAIESLTFNIDSRRPREHRVTVRLEGIDVDFNMDLDTNCNLLIDSYGMVAVNYRSRQHFLNAILRRLYFITSGLSSSAGSELGTETGGRHLEYQRAHYRYLVSTLHRPITMESYGAQVHAREIKEDYGIDIFSEIRRRRMIGTLRPDQYLTFVREVTPAVASALVLPNDLKYRPELIHIPAT